MLSASRRSSGVLPVSVGVAASSRSPLARRLALASALALGAFAGSAQAVAATSWVSTSSKALPLDSTFVTSPVASNQTIHVIVAMKTQNLDVLKSFIANQRTPGSPEFGQLMTSAQTIANFSPTADQVRSVTDYLTANGFTNITTTASRVFISGDVSMANAQAAFNTQLVNFVSASGETLRVNLTDVQVPSAIGDLVESVFGLQTAVKSHTNITKKQLIETPDFSAIARAARVKKSALSSRAATKASNPTAGILPQATYEAADFRAAYDANPAPTGQATVLGIVTGGTDLLQVIADLRQVEAETGDPYVPVEIQQVAAVPSPQTTANDDEWDLDSQSATGIAYNVNKVIFYNGSALDDGITLGTDQFVTDDVAKALNISIGGCEALNVATGSTTVEDANYMKAMAQGQTVFVSAGDAGASCSVLINLGVPDAGIPSVEYPASSPYVVAVGGTSLFTNASDESYSMEITWTGTGGGTSTFESAPTWQTASGVAPTAELFRAVPDVAMNAGFNVAVAAFYAAADTVVAGAHEAVIGTSLASPLSAGVWMRIQSAHCNGFGFAAPMFYALDSAGGPLSTATGFNDVTVGTNGGYVATPGWDYTTGFGSFDVVKVNAALPSMACAANLPPLAVLQSDYSAGDAPLNVVFNGTASSDPDGDALAYYVVDFGDGSPVDVETTPVFPSHMYATAGTYTAKLQVRDARGGTSPLVSETILVGGVPLACVAPGVTILTSPPGAAGEEGVDTGMGIDDLLSTQLAEPSNMPDTLVFTITVNNLTTVLPDFRWVTYFNIPEDPTNNYYVAMVSSDGASPVFNYGIHSEVPVAGLSQYQVLGTLDAASNYTAAGTITLVLDKSDLGLKTGDVLTDLSTSIRISVPDDTSGTVSAGDGLTQDSAGAALPYTLIGNDVCGTLVTTGGKIATVAGGSSATSGGTTGGSTGTGSTGGSTSGSASGSTSSSTTPTGGASLGLDTVLLLGLAGGLRRRRARNARR